MTTTKPGALAALLTDIHTAIREPGVPGELRSSAVRKAFLDHIGPDWHLPLQYVLPEAVHTPKCVEMGWWLLHNVATDGPCEPAPTEEGAHASAAVLNAAINLHQLRDLYATAVTSGLDTVATLREELHAAEEALDNATAAYMPMVAK